MQAQWGTITDDPSLGIPFYKGMVAFAGSGYNSRTTQAGLCLFMHVCVCVCEIIRIYVCVLEPDI